MHALTLITILPFLFLFAVIGLVALLLVATAIVEFPWILLAAVAAAAVRASLLNLQRQARHPCKQVR